MARQWLINGWLYDCLVGKSRLTYHSASRASNIVNIDYHRNWRGYCRSNPRNRGFDGLSWHPIRAHQTLTIRGRFHLAAFVRGGRRGTIQTTVRELYWPMRIAGPFPVVSALRKCFNGRVVWPGGERVQKYEQSNAYLIWKLSGVEAKFN